MVVVAISVFELHIPACRSLKQKRKVVKGLVERIHSRFRVSIVESDFHDLHQRAEIALAAVHTRATDLENLLEAIRRIIDAELSAVLTRWEPQILEEDLS